MRQWYLRTALRCLKAWAVYVTSKKLRRELGAPDEDEGDAPPPPPAPGFAALMSGLNAHVSLAGMQLSSGLGLKAL